VRDCIALDNRCNLVMVGFSILMQESMRSLFRWSAWLCLSLMLWTAAAESTHNHPSQTDAASCSICVAAHSTSPTVSSTHVRPVFTTVGVLREEAVIAKARLDGFELGSRGPPVV
jgi:hypothetical protein